jgi:hypothetical protein
MQEQRGKERFGNRRNDYRALDLETDWNYLRANLDHPALRMGGRLGSGLAEWLLRRLHSSTAPAPQLSILARIALGPRQSLALVEAEGVHLLVGTSADGAPSFFSLRTGVGGHAEGSGNAKRDRIWGRVFEPETERSDGAASGEAGRSLRAVAGTAVLGASAGGRKPARPRLTGRVSWV